MGVPRAGGWGAPSHHWAAVIVLACLDFLHSSRLAHYVCTLCVCVCISGRMRAQFVRMYVYVGQTEGGMVPLSTGWPRTGWPLAFRNSSELLVSDTKLGTTLRDWSVLFIGACCLRGCPQAREVGGVEAIESSQPYWTHFLLLDVRFSRSLESDKQRNRATPASCNKSRHGPIQGHRT